MTNQMIAKDGLIGWLVHNRITPNLIMLTLLIGGFFWAVNIKQEVFPEFELDVVVVSVAYPGASPEEVERGIIVAIEEAVRGLDGVKKVKSTAQEGAGIINIELRDGVDVQRVYQEIQQEVDRITTFPQDAERPTYRLLMRRREVIRLQLYGDVSEWAITQAAEQVREALLNWPGITQVDLIGVRGYELQVMISPEQLRRYGLTLSQIATAIRASSLELPGGFVATPAGKVLMRIKERRDWAAEFVHLPILVTPAGGIITLGDIATVADDFEQVDKMAFFDGQRAVGIGVFRVGDQTPIGVARAVHQAMEEISRHLPPTIHWVITQDDSDVYRQRLELLIRNAVWGLSLVLLLLGSFLEIKLAFWVTMGIPVSFLGSFLFLPMFDVTINMISLFAFIMALGIVVDDAIVIGENIYNYRRQGMNLLQASIIGARDVAIPVFLSVGTNIIAFVPMLFVPGVAGKFWRVIPTVVITVFSISLFESIFILPSHLAHSRARLGWRWSLALHQLQQGFSQGFERFVSQRFAPFLGFLLRYRYAVVAAGIAILIGICGYVFSGRIGVIMMPRVEADLATAKVTLPVGSPLWLVRQAAEQLENAARTVVQENGRQALSRGIFTEINEDQVEVTVFLTDPEVRPISTMEFVRLWRQKTGSMEQAEMLVFEADRGGPGAGAAVTVQLSHPQIPVLQSAATRLAQMLSTFPNVRDIDDGFRPGKPQLNFTLKPEGKSLGLTAQEVARQVRNAFFGAEALRLQRGRSEVRVRVKFPPEYRASEYDIEQMLIRTPAGTDVPLRQIADIQRGFAYTVINRQNGRRTVQVSANVDPIEQTEQVLAVLTDRLLPQLMAEFPGLTYDWEGMQADFRESTRGLMRGFLLALGVIYAVLAIPFGSYIQPLIIMTAIPFGIVGAVFGHMAMGYALSLMSLMGIVALSGVVVNDSLVLIDYANQIARQSGGPAVRVMVTAAVRRFRPILLTTLTTFGGLSPMIFETSRQARFMIPMAISLGFGIVFATGITLLLVPCLYCILDDIVRMVKRWILSLS